MTLSSDTLATELENCSPVDNESDAIDNFVSAFETYFYDSSVGGTSPEDGALDVPIEAMKTAMAGYNTSAPSAIVSGLTALWSSITSIASSVWLTTPPLATTTPPPGLVTLAATLAATGTYNASNSLSLTDSVTAMANNIHSAIIGGTATDTTAPTPVVLPIL